MPTEEERIAFNHVVAGHDGMDSNLTGELVIKPCDPSEIVFYNSLGGHEDFAGIVPFFVGELAVAKDQSAALQLLATQNGQATPTQTDNTLSSTLAVIPEARAPSLHTDEVPHALSVTPNSAKRISWKPSEGKKKNTGLAIVLENVAAGFTSPNILDVKLGARLWADDAPASKRQRLEEVSKTTTSGSLGFRIAGMKLWNGEAHNTDAHTRTQVDQNIELKDGYKCYTKHYGRTLTTDNVKEGFLAYFGASKPTTNGKLKFRHRRTRSVVRRMSQRLRNIETVLATEESRMYSASILMVYEGDEDALERAYQDEKARENAAVKASERLGAHENLPGRSKPTEQHQLGDKNGDDLDDNYDDDDDDDDDEEEAPKIEDVRLIDFAHAQWTPGQGRDENALRGIQSVIRILDEISGNV